MVTTAGDKLGGIGQIYLDDQTGESNFLTAQTGLFGTSESVLQVVTTSSSALPTGAPGGFR